MKIINPTADTTSTIYDDKSETLFLSVMIASDLQQEPLAEISAASQWPSRVSRDGSVLGPAFSEALHYYTAEARRGMATPHQRS